MIRAFAILKALLSTQAKPRFPFTGNLTRNKSYSMRTYLPNRWSQGLFI